MTSKISKEAYVVRYLNTITNGSSTSYTSANASAHALVQFDDARTDNIVDSAGDYDLALRKWVLNTSLVPNKMVPMAPSPNVNPNQTIYVITLVSGAFKATQPVIWVPEDTSAIPRYSSVGIQDNTKTRYWYNYSITHLISCFNTAISAGIADLITQGATGLGSAKAVINYNSESGLISVYATSEFATVGGVVSMSFNEATYTMFVNLRYIFNMNNVGYENMVYVGLNELSSNEVVINSTTYIQMSQDQPCIDAFVDIGDLMLRLNLPVDAEIIGPGDFQFGISTHVDVNSGNTTSYITEHFTIDSDNKRGTVIYTPTVLKRLVMKGNAPLKNISGQIFFLDKYGIQYPLLLCKDTNCIIEIEFYRKGVPIP